MSVPPRTAPALLACVACLACACGSFGDAGEPASSGGEDAGTDVGRDASAEGGGSYCSSRTDAYRCFDFDAEDADASALDGWTGSNRSTNGVLVRDREHARSLPFSLVASVPKLGERARLLLGGVPQTSGRVAVELSVRVEEMGASGAGQVMAISQGNLHLLFYVGPAGDFLQEFSDDGSKELAKCGVPTMGVGTWHRVRLQLSGTTGRVSVEQGGSCEVTLAGSWTTGDVTAGVGLGYVSGADGPWKLRYDDVLVGAP